MSEPKETATGEVEQDRGASVIGWLDRVNRRLGGTPSVSVAFGEPIERDGVTVVPVARSRFMIGGGASGGSGARDADGGTGGMGMTDPVGYLEIKDGGAVFRPTRHPALSLVVPLAAIAGATAVLVLREILRRS
ncbi:hypothetical protein HNR23_003073 [Nocardiopsis mwathae]|uniref:Sporulation protein n=1 Tax=Nocardiopsis mwathae TaxID=1472723 RepID=A0A7X0D669_9ACTN|nr:sporulation protein [Nocardiopsis mwathae]MBB6173013.1 hypothetical protein [Nocardiopsis mwathae]